MTLDTMPSSADLRRMAIDRQKARFGRIIDPILVDPRDLDGKVDTGSRAIAFHGRQVVEPDHDLADARMVDFVVARQTDPSMSAVIYARREGNKLWLEIETPPRTKKNHTTLGIRQSKAYKRYEQEIAGAIAAVKRALALPLPDREYNIAVTYVVDRWGEKADRPGLDNALFDALQNAGVISNDWWFRTMNGSPRPVIGDPRPRVEISITPLPDEG